jgi:cellulose synthase/poly-beta-1,6-N-acetylglucosamine synthase-like glycosyltransferase
VTAPLLVDADLLAGPVLVPGVGRPVRALVWWGDRLLGERTLPPFQGTPRDARPALLSSFRAEVAALETVTASSPPVGEPGHVTVVVCTRDRADQLVGCLEALSRLHPAPADVIVVDNAPTSRRTAEVTERWGVRRVLEPSPGLSHARNAGWRAAHTPVVAYTDDDARPHPHWVGGLARAFASQAVDCVTGLVVAAELMTPAQRLFEANGGMRKGLQLRLLTTAEVGVQGYRLGVGANMAFRRAALERIGGFDVRLGPGRPTRGGDDLDAFVRVLASGGVAAYQPSAVVRHVHRRDLLGLGHQYRDNGTGYAALLRKYELDGGELGAAAVRERARWRRQRHVRGLLGAIRRRRAGAVLEIAADILGSTRGRVAFAAEAALLADGQHG